ncbi:factor eIF-2B subunit beta [Seminavis robusta]|uniref:Translation initiation factor eIF2B subunit beta n=1 Tax=Seminavis robusta TaxID=568900 RepID=A0A9N8E7J2_9STRA|nr:factor eIF-2B subunit beta [Seminavis robusta]|eukprot:Sro626_g177840.1 factor eIF-2B subunit beta (434) ;mRNA; r:50791-52092
MTASSIPDLGSNSLSTSDPAAVRSWLSKHHPKQLALLDKFEIELRLGRLSSTTKAGPDGVIAAVGATSTSDRLLVTRRTVGLLKHIIGATRWKNGAQLLVLLRGLGRELHEVGGFREPVIENIVRRVMAAVREEAAGEPDGKATDTGRLSLQSILWALPQHVKSPSNRSLSRTDSHQRQSSIASEADLESTNEFPPAFYVNRPELKQTVMEAIQEIVTELEDVYGNIEDQATNHIHAGEVILTYGKSKTIERFLIAAAEKKRTFQVVVCEDSPSFGGHEMAKSLAKAGIDTIVIHDSAIFAVMARVNKVLLSAHAVLANGGLVASSGSNMVALGAYNNAVPVVVITGMFKLCPMFPHEGQDTLNDLVSPSKVMDITEIKDDLLSSVELINPVHDYVKPEHVSLYVTNVGSFQPSYIYRLLAEYYHTDDWKSFE